MSGPFGQGLMIYLPSSSLPLCRAHESAAFAGGQELHRVHVAKQLDHLGHQPGPACLVTGAKARAIVAVEVFVEQNVIPPVRPRLEFFRGAVRQAACLLRLAERCG